MELSTLFKDASVYGQTTPEKTNLKLQSMQGLFDGTVTLYIYANLASSIIESIKMAQSHGVKKIALVGVQNLFWLLNF